MPTDALSTPLDAVEILLVEDNDADAALTVRALRKRKLTNAILRVKDGAEALDYLLVRGEYAQRANLASPRVILLDLKLPKLDGLDVLRALKTDAKMKTIPVVVLTSSREDRDLALAYELGANSYVVKPVVFEDFVQSVEQLGTYWTLLNERPSG